MGVMKRGSVLLRLVVGGKDADASVPSAANAHANANASANAAANDLADVGPKTDFGRALIDDWMRATRSPTSPRF